MTPETIFQAGSTGKQFLQTAILLLAEEGKLSLDDSITKYFPEAPEWWKPITIRHLLTHTSGLPDVWGEPDSRGMYANALLDMRRDYTEEELLRVQSSSCSRVLNQARSGSIATPATKFLAF